MNPGDIDPGQPIRVLLDQEHEPSTNFMGRVRRRIQRRTAASHVATYSWNMPKVILIEMVSVFEHFLKAFNSNKERRR